MNKYTEKELEKIASEHNPENGVVYATEDGNVFSEKNKRFADDHGNKHGLKIYKFGEPTKEVAKAEGEQTEGEPTKEVAKAPKKNK